MVEGLTEGAAVGVSTELLFEVFVVGTAVWLQYKLYVRMRELNRKDRE